MITNPKGLVLDFFDLAFTRREPREAAHRFLSRSYIQHNPMVADGADAFAEMMEGLFAHAPQASSSVKRVISEGDLVVVHYHVKMAPEQNGSAVVDIFRVEDGRIIEHWDVVQAVPPEPANQNGMF